MSGYYDSGIFNKQLFNFKWFTVFKIKLFPKLHILIFFFFLYLKLLIHLLFMWKWTHIFITPYHLCYSKYIHIYTILPVFTKEFRNNHDQNSISRFRSTHTCNFFFPFNSQTAQVFERKKKWDSQKLALDISFHLSHCTLGLKHHFTPFFANVIVDQPVLFCLLTISAIWKN